MFLAMKSEPAVPDDVQTAADLLDTLAAHQQTCAGMAANMIGQNKRIIAFANGKEHIAMLNPRIVRKEGAYQTQEGCLSLDGLRETTRYRKITVTWQDLDLREHTKAFSGFVAQVIQHEVDHCEGIVI